VSIILLAKIGPVNPPKVELKGKYDLVQRLIDKRLDKVKDWEIIEKDSRINEIIKNSSILVKNKYNRYEAIINPNATLYINQFINTIIIPDR